MDGTAVPLIKNLLLLDAEGKRIAVKYYGETWGTSAIEQAFEKSLFTKTQRSNARGEPEVIMFDSVVSVFKTIGDISFYVTGDQDENEIVLLTVLQAFYEAVTLLLRYASIRFIICIYYYFIHIPRRARPIASAWYSCTAIISSILSNFVLMNIL